MNSGDEGAAGLDDRSGRPAADPITIDLTQLVSLSGLEAEMLTQYLTMIQVQRQDFNGRTHSARAGPTGARRHPRRVSTAWRPDSSRSGSATSRKRGQGQWPGMIDPDQRDGLHSPRATRPVDGNRASGLRPAAFGDTVSAITQRLSPGLTDQLSVVDGATESAGGAVGVGRLEWNGGRGTGTGPTSCSTIS